MPYELPKGVYPYPLSKLASDGGSYSQTFLQGDPSAADAVGQNWYVICLTADQWTMIKSSLQVGAPIAYPDTYNEPLQIIWQANEFPNEFPEDTCVDICQFVLDCINTDTSIQEAIANFSSTSNINELSPENVSNLASQLVNNPLGCDNDIIFGMTRQLVEFSDRLIKDLFEQIDASQLSATNVGYLIKLIPFVETLPIDELFELTDKLVDDMETAYLSASTQLLKDEIACDLFCIAQANGCALTLEDVRDYFVEQSGVVFTYTSVLDFVADFLSGVFIGNAIYYAMNILFFQTFAFGGKFLEYIFEDYLKVINSMYNDPDSDWTTVCDDCSWTSTLDFTTSNYGATFIADDGAAPIGLWTNGVGFVGANVTVGGVQRHNLIFRIPFDDSTIESYTWTGSITKGNNCDGVNNIAVSQLYLNNGNVVGGTDFQTKAEFPLSTPTAIDLQISAVALVSDEAQCNLMSSHQGQAGSVLCTGLTITGTGTKPPQLP